MNYKKFQKLLTEIDLCADHDFELDVLDSKVLLITAQEKHVENLFNYIKTPFGANDVEAAAEIKRFLGLDKRF